MEPLSADSPGARQLVMAVEEEFSISIPDDDANDVKTLGEFVALVVVFLAKAA